MRVCKTERSQVWRLTPVTPILRTWSQENCESEPSLGCIVSSKSAWATE